MILDCYPPDKLSHDMSDFFQDLNLVTVLGTNLADFPFASFFNIFIYLF